MKDLKGTMSILEINDAMISIKFVLKFVNWFGDMTKMTKKSSFYFTWWMMARTNAQTLVFHPSSLMSLGLYPEFDSYLPLKISMKSSTKHR